MASAYVTKCKLTPQNVTWQTLTDARNVLKIRNLSRNVKYRLICPHAVLNMKTKHYKNTNSNKTDSEQSISQHTILHPSFPCPNGATLSYPPPVRPLSGLPPWTERRKPTGGSSIRHILLGLRGGNSWTRLRIVASLKENHGWFWFDDRREVRALERRIDDHLAELVNFEFRQHRRHVVTRFRLVTLAKDVVHVNATLRLTHGRAIGPRLVGHRGVRGTQSHHVQFASDLREALGDAPT